jgi:5'-methylthioadenosine phosphorylase
MESAIITGTGIYEIPGITFKPERIDTPFGTAQVYLGEKDGFEIAFLARHGIDHSTPPHKINYLANIKALQMLGVKRVLATYAVGSINRELPPTSLVLLSDFLDFTNNRPLSFYNGEKWFSAYEHKEVYCSSLRRKVQELSEVYNLIKIHPSAVYVAPMARVLKLRLKYGCMLS